MKFYVNIGEDGDGYNVIDSITDYPIIDKGGYTLFWDTDKYGWITEETLESDILDDLISKNPSLLYNGWYEVVFADLDEIHPNILKEIFGTSDDEEIKNNINWKELIKKSKDKLTFPRMELEVSEINAGKDWKFVAYTQYIDAEGGELTYVGMSPRKLLQFIKDNCYKG